MLDAEGRPVSDTAVSMKLADLKTQVASALLSLRNTSLQKEGR
jgi:hypothetical protein